MVASAEAGSAWQAVRWRVDEGEGGARKRGRGTSPDGVSGHKKDCTHLSMSGQEPAP